MKAIFYALVILGMSLSVCQAQEYYEIRTYEMKFRGNTNVLENYLSKALIPALNKYGVSKVGVFKDLGKPEPIVLVVAIPFSSLASYEGYKSALENDQTYQEIAKTYFNTVGLDKPLYDKVSISLAKSFQGNPKLIIPKTNPERIYEWRTYEAYNEDALKRKIAMFNEAELKVFDQVGLHRTFFAEVLAGEFTPSLTYMIGFSNMEERDANWAKFSADADWKRISNDPKYANSHSKTWRRFLVPTNYSQW
jgi:hypothetical protein